MRFFTQGKQFMLDGKPFVIRSGAVHYFRIPRIYWEDRLLKLKECGLNTVETYIAWNIHEPQENVFDFQGEKNVEEFIRIADSLGLYVILRPGPYICAEWEGGGLPFWLLNYPDLRVRCSDPIFLEKTYRYLEKCVAIIRPHLIENGGNVLMVQVENEYGSYGSDRAYTQSLADFYSRELPNCMLCTSDGVDATRIELGGLDGVLATGNFGSKVEQNMSALEKLRPNQPLMCMEFWCGWFDTWDEPHHTRLAEEKVAEIRSFLKNGYSFNIYMFIGGTNFGFMNGANIVKNVTQVPQTTSYDYDALLSECGDRTDAYYRVRDAIAEYYPVPPLTAKDSEKRAYGAPIFKQKALLFDNLSNIGTSCYDVTPRNMERYNQAYGYMVYRTHGSIQESIRLMDLKDRAVLYCDGKKIGELDRNRDAWLGLNGLVGEELTILVENRGRVNYGAYFFDKKGISNVLVGCQYKYGWENISLPMDNLQNLQYTPIEESNRQSPAFFKGTFTVDTPCDTFFNPKGFSRGFILVNGFNIGRFNNTGNSQKTYYVPKNLLKQGENELVLFDEDGTYSNESGFIAQPQW